MIFMDQMTARVPKRDGETRKKIKHGLSAMRSILVRRAGDRRNRTHRGAHA
jgi:hypothetical protein